MTTATRREFLKTVGAVGCLAMGSPAVPVLGESKKNVPVVDTHLHCFAGAGDARFPYHKRAPYRPQQAASPQHLLKCMDGAGVFFAVVVHPEPYQDDHRYLEYCLGVEKRRLKCTVLFFADRPGSVEKMPALVKKHPGRIVSARIHAYAPERLPPFGTAELRNYWKTAGELGLAIQLHFEPRHAPGFEPLIKEFPKTTVVVDHLGRPFQGTPKQHAVVIRWARFPNTIMKIAALPSQEKYPHRDIQPIIKQLTDAFGADRMIYGGGFNGDATAESYRAYRDRVQSLISHLSADDQKKLLGGTAMRIYRFT